MEELNVSLKDKGNSAPGMDDVSYGMLKNLPISAKIAMLKTYNGCLGGDPIPGSWKKYNVLPILKPNKNPDNVNNLRPIVLSSCYCKTLEIMIKNCLDFLLEKNSFFGRLQSGFRKGMSIHNNIAFLTTQVQLAFKQGETILAIFLDIKSAYDNVNIYKLFNKLNQINVPMELSNLIFRILQNRLLYTKKSDGSYLGPVLATSGLPQGSPLSTILFNVYTADLFKTLSSDVPLMRYADDLVIIELQLR